MQQSQGQISLLGVHAEGLTRVSTLSTPQKAGWAESCNSSWKWHLRFPLSSQALSVALGHQQGYSMSWLEPYSSHWPADHPVPHAMTSPGSSLGSGGSSTWLSEEEEPFQSYRDRNPIQRGAQSLQQGGSEGQIGDVPSCTLFSSSESSYCRRDERKDTQSALVHPEDAPSSFQRGRGSQA